MKNIIVRTNGEPFATRHSAEQQLSKRFLRDTHEVVEYGGGFGLAPTEEEGEPVTLRSGDYVSTVGMTEDRYHAVAGAFMKAGANKGEYPDIILKNEYIEFGWCDHHGALWHQGGPGNINGYFEGRQLTIAQVLGTTQQEEKPVTAFDTLIAAARKRNEARAALEEADGTFQLALDAANAELGEGFEIRERTEPEEDMCDPSNWRAGDVVECVSEDNDALTKGRTYKVLGLDCDGDPVIRHDTGGEGGQFSRLFRFHHRPT